MLVGMPENVTSINDNTDKPAHRENISMGTFLVLLRLSCPKEGLLNNAMMESRSGSGRFGQASGVSNANAQMGDDEN